MTLLRNCRSSLAAIAFAALLSGPIHAQVAVDSTAWRPISSDGLARLLRETIDETRLLGTDKVANALTIAAHLGSLDAAQVSFVVIDSTLQAEELLLDLRYFTSLEIRFRGAGNAFSRARDLLDQQWRRSLRPIDGRINVGLKYVIRAGRDPALVAVLNTRLEFGCLGYAIELVTRDTTDGHVLELLGISPPDGLCPATMGPARANVHLPDSASRRRLYIMPRDVATSPLARTPDVYTLVVTDSSARLVLETATFTDPDTATNWRVRPNTFVFWCNRHLPLCEDFREWLRGHPGIEEFAFPRGGVLPFLRGVSPDYARYFFRYDKPAALEDVRACLDAIGPVIRDAVGVTLQIGTWRDEVFSAWSQKRNNEPHIEPPRRVSTACRSDDLSR